MDRRMLPTDDNGPASIISRGISSFLLWLYFEEDSSVTVLPHALIVGEDVTSFFSDLVVFRILGKKIDLPFDLLQDNSFGKTRRIHFFTLLPVDVAAAAVVVAAAVVRTIAMDCDRECFLNWFLLLVRYSP
mmetsp:Transcript_25124/g.55093  ORF Transcript_25124/g.55093 Transcript_25124/m.55093 type:complete len:131 (-) Transcript_25124:228-620(-)